MSWHADISLARELDAQDELAPFRDEFVIGDPNLIYLDGNSLGRLPKRTVDFMRNAIEREWGERLIRAWNDGWIHTPTNLGAKIARLVGAQADEILVTEATSINLFKLAVAALQAVTPFVGYLPHAWHPLRHRPGIEDPASIRTHDVVFVGTGFPERFAWFNAIDWTGIDLGLYGTWEDDPAAGVVLTDQVRACVAGDQGENTTAAALDRRARRPGKR